MEFWQIIIVFLILYICTYALAKLICQCIERCSVMKAYGKFRENESNISLKKLKEAIDNAESEINKK